MTIRNILGRGVQPPADPYFNYTNLLLNGDGTNGAQNNIFLDSSTNASSISRTGTPTQGSFSPYGNLWSNYFDGRSYIYAPPSNLWYIGGGNFCIEAWIYITGDTDAVQAYPNGRNGVIVRNAGAGTSFSFVVTGDATTTGTGLAIYGSSTNWQVNYSFKKNTWYHVAVQNYNNFLGWEFYINGNIYLGTGQKTGTIGNPTFAMYVGGSGTQYYPTTDSFKGFISNVRISNDWVYPVMDRNTGVPSTYKVPTAPLTATASTILLTCQSNKFMDNSVNNFTMTTTTLPDGLPVVSASSPFQESSVYKPSSKGASGYFDGNGDYLTVLNNNSALDFGTQDFTIEFWTYILTGAYWGSPLILGTPPSYQPNSSAIGAFPGSGAGGISLISGLAGGIIVGESASLSVNQWVHYAFVRSGNNFTLYRNGVNISTNSSSEPLSFIYLDATYISNNWLNTYFFYGYLSDLRTVKGTALYNTNFTPPTTPLTAIANTSFLLNFSNAGIPDLTQEQDLLSVGNAQVSTSLKKYGTGSLAFDGVGDYFSFVRSKSMQFGSGDFTLEGWVYRNDSSDGVIYSDRTTSAFEGIVVYIKSNKIGLLATVNGTSWGIDTVTSPTGNDVPTSTWSYITIVRSLSTWYVFIDGVQSYTQTLSGVIVQDQTTSYLGADLPDSVYLSGYIDDFRVTNGIARYTSNFTPPSQALPAY